MIDIKFLREQPDAVKENIRKKESIDVIIESQSINAANNDVSALLWVLEQSWRSHTGKSQWLLL